MHKSLDVNHNFCTTELEYFTYKKISMKARLEVEKKEEKKARVHVICQDEVIGKVKSEVRAKSRC